LHIHRSRYRRARPRRQGSLTPLQAGSALTAGLALAWYAHTSAPPHGEPAAVTAMAAAAGGAAQMSTTSSNVALGKRMAAAAGWTGPQWSCLDALWTRESGWQTEVWNTAGSGAYGIPQSLPASKMAAAGADYMTDPATQIRWGLSYIAGRYGTPCGAWAHETSAGWY
jgi:resuscitation-promoting factor RpfB